MKNLLALILPFALLACANLPSTSSTRVGHQATRGETQCESVRLPSSNLISGEFIDAGLPKSGQWRDGFDLADMNHDGHTDLVFGPARKALTPPKIFLGNNKAQFQEWKAAHFPPLPYDYGDIKAADLNRDGRMDLVLGSHLRGVVALIQEADGYFAPWGEGLEYRAPGQMPGVLSFSSRAIAVTDWNGDSSPDIVALNEGPSRFAKGERNTEAMALFLNRNGAWERVAAKQMLNSYGDAITVGEVNGDGFVDAMIGTQFSGTQLLLQLGDGNSFTPSPVHSLPNDAAVTAVLLQDFTRDGRDEIFAATRAMSERGFCMALQQIDRNPSGEEKSSTLWREQSRDPVRTILHADLNRDGRDDLLALHALSGVNVFIGNKSGFSQDAVLPYPSAMQSCQLFDAAIQDFNQDGKLELVMSFAGEDTGLDAMPCKHGGGIEVMKLSSSMHP